jgi:hypothetical protein
MVPGCGSAVVSCRVVSSSRAEDQSRFTDGLRSRENINVCQKPSQARVRHYGHVEISCLFLAGLLYRTLKLVLFAPKMPVGAGMQRDLGRHLCNRLNIKMGNQRVRVVHIGNR